MSKPLEWRQESRLYSAAKLEPYFPALWLMAVLLKLLAWLAIPIGFVVIFSMKGHDADMPPALAGLTILASATVGFGLWVSSDILKLLLCLEYNTRRKD